MGGITRRLAEFVAATSYEDLPDEVRERAKLLVTDSFGIAIRARNDAPATPSLVAAVEKLGLARGEASVVGDEAGYAPPGAAFLNGALIHSLDFDDTHPRASLHSSAPLVPAALAAAETTAAARRDATPAIPPGFEVPVRLTPALVPAAPTPAGARGRRGDASATWKCMCDASARQTGERRRDGPMPTPSRVSWYSVWSEPDRDGILLTE